MTIKEKQVEFSKMLLAARKPEWKTGGNAGVKYDDDWRFSKFEFDIFKDDLAVSIQDSSGLATGLFDSYSEKAEKTFSLFQANRDRLTLCHASAVNKGVLIDVPKKISGNVRVTCRGTGFFHSLLFLGDNSKLRLAFDFDVVTASHVVEVFLGANSVLETAFAERGKLYSSKNFSYGKNSSSKTVTFMQEGGCKQFHNHFLNAKGAATENYFASFGQKNDCFDLTVKNLHYAKNTSSTTLMKASLFEHSSAVFRGDLDISGKGAGSKASLYSHALMFDEAFAREVPSLDIRNNDVIAAHGASSSKISDEDLFYAESRGLDDLQAKKLFAQAFIESITRKSFDESLSKHLEVALC